MDSVEIIRDKKDEIIKRYGVEKIGVFGSVVRDDFSGESDVDVVVEFGAKQATFDNYMNLKHFLEELLEREVDLVTADTIKSRIRDDVLEEVEYV